MVLFHYEKVYNFDIADNENYYVTEDGILVHNGYKDDLPKRENIARGDAGAYQSKTVGNTEYKIYSGGESVWVDGIDEVNNMAQDAKFVSKPKSPYIENSGAPEFLQTKINDEFYRYSKVINDLSNKQNNNKGRPLDFFRE